MKLVMLPPARREMLEAARWYERKLPGLGGRFLDEISNALVTLRDFPGSVPPLDAVYRRVRVNVFPYGLVFRIDGDLVSIVAVMHLKRRPGYRRRRTGLGPTRSEPDQAADLRSYGRKRGRKPSVRQEALLKDLLPRVAVDLTAPVGQRQETFLEIGFGGAEHLIWQAERNPGIAFLGCEPFEDGVIKALTAIADKGLGNIRLHADDARPLLRALPEASIGRVFILFPDPWPKRKHQKRRLVSPATLALLARIMKPGAELRVATDIGDYARSTLIAIRAEPRFRWTATSPQDWRERPADWPGTRYEAKGLREGRRCYYFRFERVPG